MPRTIDLNCDLGEALDGVDDARLMPLVSSCNIACGGHAGDRESMTYTVALATEHGVAVGAHPSYPDREAFGRRPMGLEPDEIGRRVYEQCLRLAEVTDVAGVNLQHVKPHGALYNDLIEDRALAVAVYGAVQRLDPTLKIYGLAGSDLAQVAEELGLPFVHEAFADRRYETARRLVQRSGPGGVLQDTSRVVAQVEAIVGRGVVETVRDGTQDLSVDSLCLHSDTPGAPVLLDAVREWLEVNDVGIRPPG